MPPPIDAGHRPAPTSGTPQVRADYLDQVVWDHITTLLADPSLIRAEIDRRLDTARTSDPVTHRALSD